jgi:proteasome lid subunit RPN8/RPN11
LLLGRVGRITIARPTPNVHPTPRSHFEIDPQALIDAHRAERAGGLKVMGYFHSHPTGDPVPSATDRALAAGDGKVWAIVAGDEVAFWQDDRAGFHALSYQVIGR